MSTRRSVSAWLLTFIMLAALVAMEGGLAFAGKPDKPGKPGGGDDPVSGPISVGFLFGDLMGDRLVSDLLGSYEDGVDDMDAQVSGWMKLEFGRRTSRTMSLYLGNSLLLAAPPEHISSGVALPPERDGDLSDPEKITITHVEMNIATGDARIPRPNRAFREHLPYTHW